MTAFVVLLRGVNVGGNNKVPMAHLRTGLSASGFDDVRTYIQSGNIVVSTAARTKPSTVARRVTDLIRAEFGVDVGAVAVAGSTLEQIVAANPFADEPDPKKVHVLFLLDPEQSGADERLADVVAKAKAKRDAGERAVLDGPAIYLHTPNGFGDSELAKAMSAKRFDATARNWRTVMTLLEMAREVGD